MEKVWQETQGSIHTPARLKSRGQAAQDQQYFGRAHLGIYIFFSSVLADFLSHLPTLFLVILLLDLNEYVCKLSTVIHIVVGCVC